MNGPGRQTAPPLEEVVLVTFGASVARFEANSAFAEDLCFAPRFDRGSLPGLKGVAEVYLYPHFATEFGVSPSRSSFLSDETVGSA